MKRLIASAFVVLVAFGAVALQSFPARAQDAPVGPLVEISRPNAVGSCNTGFNTFGTYPMSDTGEPFVAVNPVHPNNIVAAWIQGTFQDDIVAVSLDGGQNWQRVPIPLTICSGGPLLGAGDPWLSFASNGDLYAIAVAGNTSNEIFVTKSIDGGLHWSAATLVSGNVDLPPDHPSLTADPTNPSYVYAIWDGVNSKHSSAAVFTRTTDGGATWETARPIVQTAEQSFIQFSQILVLPNGTLVDVYEVYEQQPNKSCTSTNLQVLRSTDQGQTWSGPSNAVTMTPIYTPTCGTFVVDPKTGQGVFDNTNQYTAVDPRSGNLYAVWEDGRFSNFQHNDIALSMLSDGGLTWSAPIRVNQTPVNIPSLNRQAFLPVVGVAEDGTVGVTYYDFRFNNSNPGVNTDYWLSLCHPRSKLAASDQACWNTEVRLTDTSFNLQANSMILFDGRIFFGDYFGLAGTGDGFVSTFTAVDSQNVTSTFARRVGP